MVKRYQVKHSEDGSVTVEVDHDLMTEENLHEINSFWCNAEDRISASDGNVLHAVLKNLAAQVIMENVSYTMNTSGVISRFDYQKGEGREGWPKMDGSAGIRIIDVETPNYDDEDFSVKEVS